MKYSTVAGLDKPVSRLVLGSTMFDPDQPSHWFPMLDHYRDNGGNCVDTAAIYGNGASERTVGAWLAETRQPRRHRPDRQGRVHHRVHAGPGDHRTARVPAAPGYRPCRHLPDAPRQPDRPVGQFVERLNEHLRAGEVRAFGGSNWSPQRIAEANTYAAEHGLVGFAASSPQFPLGRWNEPPWAGCLTATDPATRRWYEKSGLALFAWSSQAAGFFTGRYSPTDRTDPKSPTRRGSGSTPTTSAGWTGSGSGGAGGVPMAQVALAYVLCQPAHVFALTGPLTLGELRDSVAAVGLALTADELRHLNLEDAGDATPAAPAR